MSCRPWGGRPTGRQMFAPKATRSAIVVRAVVRPIERRERPAGGWRRGSSHPRSRFVVLAGSRGPREDLQVELLVHLLDLAKHRCIEEVPGHGHQDAEAPG